MFVRFQKERLNNRITMMRFLPESENTKFHRLSNLQKQFIQDWKFHQRKTQ